jgi:hypothetical protein
MMPSLFVLDVPEFAPLIAGAAGTHKVRRRNGYAAIESADQVVVERAKSGLPDAVWFGALTGGYEGRVVEFSAERLVIGKP